MNAHPTWLPAELRYRACALCSAGVSVDGERCCKHAQALPPGQVALPVRLVRAPTGACGPDAAAHRITPTEAQLDEAFAIMHKPDWPATRAEVTDHPIRGRLVALIGMLIALGYSVTGRPVVRADVQRPEHDGPLAEPDAAPCVPPSTPLRPRRVAAVVALPEPRQIALFDRKRAAAGDVDD